MVDRLFRAAAVAAFALASASPILVSVAPAQAHTSVTVVRADRIRFVYPDSAETSNDPFPPYVNQAAVRRQLRTILVSVHHRRETMAQYLLGLHMNLRKVATIDVAGDAAAVYTYR